MADDDFRVEFDPAMLASFLRALKAFEPSLATATRRNLRRAGDDTVSDMRRTVMSGGARYHVGARTGIRAGLKTAVATGKYRQGVRLSGSSSAIPEGHKAMLRLYNKRSFRHPVFGRGWVSQSGNPYFGSVIKRHEDDMLEAIWRALEEAMNKMGGMS